MNCKKIYKSPYISDLNSYILFAIRKMLDSWQSIHLLCEDRIDVSSLVTLSRMIVDNYTILHFIHINSKTIEERELRHYLYVLDGVENRIKELRKFPSLTFDLNYIEQTEIDQLAQQIETTMQSDLKAKDQLLKKIRNNPLCNVDMENIIQRRNWKYKKLNNTIKEIDFHGWNYINKQELKIVYLNSYLAICLNLSTDFVCLILHIILLLLKKAKS